MPLRVGDVIRLWDWRLRSPKFKRHICICPERRLFLRINSRAFFQPHLIIRADTADFLDNDSYVELQQLVVHGEMAIRDAEYLGRLNIGNVRSLTVAVSVCEALPQEVKDLILDRLAGMSH